MLGLWIQRRSVPGEKGEGKFGVVEGVDGVLKSEVIEGCIVWDFLAGWGGGLESGVFWRGPLILHWEEYVWEEGEVS